MDSKQKAKELVDRFEDYAYYYEVQLSNEDKCIWNQKQCALICVDEILEFYDRVDVKYWKEVKQEIEKL